MSNKKNILLLGKLPPPYMGPSIATALLLQSDLSRTFNLLHVDTKVNTDLKNIGKFNFDKLKKNLAIYRKLIKINHNNKPELALIPFSQTTIGFIKDSIYIRICLLLRTKVLLHLRGSEFKIWMNRSNFLTRWYVKSTLNRCEGVIVLGNNLRYLFEDYLPENKIFVCPNGGTYQLPTKNKSKEKIKILYLGNLQPSKGIEDVIDAAKLLHDKNIKCTFDIIGGWRNEEIKKKCLAIVSEHKLDVHFYSQEESTRKFDLMAQSDIFLFPPRAPEGHPWVIIEAMASSLPVISTDQGAIVESVIDGINGFIVKSKSPEEIASKIEILENDENLRNSMSNKSRELYEANFTEEKMVQRLTSIINQITA
jgi:glycosyltransferase involved in cell wall biosynthesis